MTSRRRPRGGSPAARDATAVRTSRGARAAPSRGRRRRRAIPTGGAATPAASEPITAAKHATVSIAASTTGRATCQDRSGRRRARTTGSSPTASRTLLSTTVGCSIAYPLRQRQCFFLGGLHLRVRLPPAKARTDQEQRGCRPPSRSARSRPLNGQRASPGLRRRRVGLDGRITLQFLRWCRLPRACRQQCERRRSEAKNGSPPTHVMLLPPELTFPQKPSPASSPILLTL